MYPRRWPTKGKNSPVCRRGRARRRRTQTHTPDKAVAPYPAGRPAPAPGGAPREESLDKGSLPTQEPADGSQGTPGQGPSSTCEDARGSHPYRLIKWLGTGSFGEVWQAEAPGGVEVALKTIVRPADDRQAQRELQALELIKHLRHPFLLQTHAFWNSDDRLYIAMELADGTLRDRLKACRGAGMIGIPAAELVAYMREAADALDFLHKKHVQHGDIKPDNILLVADHAKVADFGLARPHESRRLISADGSGTPQYMAPEVWRGKVSAHSDQYSLAVTYVELRRDLPLFPDCTLPELMFKHLEVTPDLAPLLQAERQVLLRALAKDPSLRYPSCLEFAQALAGSAFVPGGSATDAVASARYSTIRPGLER